MDEELRELVARLAAEREIRPTARGEFLFASLDSPLEGPWPVVPGTLLVLWSYAHARLLRLLEQFRQRDTSVTAALEAPLQVQEPGPVSGDPLDRVPSFADLRYRGRQLIDAMVLPPESIAAVDYAVLPWIGGMLDKGAFSTTSWLLRGASPMSVAVVANPPEVDDETARILAAIPEDIVEVGIARPMTTPVVATAAEVGAGAAARWVAKQAAREVAHYAAEKAAHAAADKYRNWADRQQRAYERDRRLAEERQRQQAFRERTRWRNASVVRDAPELSDVPVHGATVDELLEARIRALLSRTETDIDA